MGASKTNQYPNEILDISTIANALGHPARITIIKALKENHIYRNVDFQSMLDLSQTAVHVHLRKLRNANIVKFQQFKNEYQAEYMRTLKATIRDSTIFTQRTCRNVLVPLINLKAACQSGSDKCASSLNFNDGL